ncbi:MAG: dihydroneopterin aldolase [Candidatus Cohnella colombiensis]|uniref:7,8-dihydroneopterin aldolase n=1 Tax=Candidatus Cohnella colombiensis TaxID=3121368 RepID=A0AA95JFJ4_9BACL|nr:MAG: dihydroneopterin aldolase [Cohnella sp.]
MDRMLLKKMVFFGYHGVIPEENRLGQKYAVDLDMRLNLRPAGHSDDVNDTVNYADVHTLVKQIVEGPAVKLIETLAEKIASSVLGTYTSIIEVTVSVTKPNPPFDITFDGVTVELRRRRGPDGAVVAVED